jgi:hypothetical protein
MPGKGIARGLTVGVLTLGAGAGVTGGPSVSRANDDGAEIAKLKGEIEQLKGRLPSQSHAMMDVGYHFANLPYLRPRVPQEPEARIINFDPTATWP